MIVNLFCCQSTREHSFTVFEGIENHCFQHWSAGLGSKPYLLSGLVLGDQTIFS